MLKIAIFGGTSKCAGPPVLDWDGYRSYCRTYKLKVRKQSFHWIVGVVVLILIFLTCGNVFPLAKVHRLEFVEGGSLDFVVFRTDLIQ